MNKKVILLVMILIFTIFPSFAISPMSASLNIDFTAGLVANIGFSDRSVSSMVYPAENILKNGKVFSYNPNTGYYETDTFYVFCQIFKPNTKVTLTGSALSDGNNSLNWTNIASGLNLNSATATSVDLLEITTTPDHACYELKLRINAITPETNWQSEYRGNLTLTISSGT